MDSSITPTQEEDAAEKTGSRQLAQDNLQLTLGFCEFSLVLLFGFYVKNFTNVPISALTEVRRKSIKKNNYQIKKDHEEYMEMLHKEEYNTKGATTTMRVRVASNVVVGVLRVFQ
jgi:F0F1-type ATP synthase membrane subunit b/b'